MRKAVIVGAVCTALVGLVLVAAQAARWAHSAHSPHSAQSPLSAQSPRSAAGMHVSGTKIVEANGNSFVMRGVSYPYAWHKTQNQSFSDIKKLGFNTVRVVLDSSIGAGEVSNVLSTCKQNRLICILENHDTTG